MPHGPESARSPRRPLSIIAALALCAALLAPAAGGQQAAGRPAAIIGVSDGAGWGPQAANELLDANITWDRVELQSGSSLLASSHGDGFKELAIVNNTDDDEPLSALSPSRWGAEVVSELQSNSGISIAEAGNEAYYKGGVANPVQYGRMYLAAAEDMKSAGIHIPLLFDMTGDYPLGSWSQPTGWSTDAHGGGWLRSAVAGVPGLAAAILANGLAVHPYGALGESVRDETGVGAVASEEAIAHTVLGSTPAVYVTEFGYNLRACGANSGACSPREQASKLTAAYRAFLADPHVAGLWWYQSHDDHIGHYGLMSNRNRPRPSFSALSAIATEQGQ